LRLALTLGEPAGIGPDLALALAGELADVVAIGCARTLAARAQQLGLPPWPHPIIDVPCASKAVPGELDRRNAEAVLTMLRRAADGALRGEFAALVTAPVHKAILNDAGTAFSGHTEFFQAHAGVDRVVMLLVADLLRVALVTTHLPLRQVPDAITAAAVLETLKVLDHGLRQQFGIPAARIAVLGLNPHAGEGGHLGSEDDGEIAPAIHAARALGIIAEGPIPADTAFTPRRLANADAVLAMFHDQGLPVLKYAGFGHAVNVTLGLPYVRTSVDHGTALDLAGTGRADAGSLRAAVQLARTLIQR
jgi:4-hydroxythreonine-4-phosphate dehydrogenase